MKIEQGYRLEEVTVVNEVPVINVTMDIKEAEFLDKYITQSLGFSGLYDFGRDGTAMARRLRNGIRSELYGYENSTNSVSPE